MQTTTVLIIIVVILTMYNYYLYRKNNPREDYRSCSDCSQRQLPASGTLVVNPFKWPYSGTSCIPEIYKSTPDLIASMPMDMDASMTPAFPDNTFAGVDLTTPDHIELE